MIIALSFWILGWLDLIIMVNSREKAQQAAFKHQTTARDPETLGSEGVWQFEILKKQTGRSLEARATARLEPWCQDIFLLTLYPWSPQVLTFTSLPSRLFVHLANPHTRYYMSWLIFHCLSSSLHLSRVAEKHTEPGTRSLALLILSDLGHLSPHHWYSV